MALDGDLVGIGLALLALGYLIRVLLLALLAVLAVLVSDKGRRATAMTIVSWILCSSANDPLDDAHTDEPTMPTVRDEGVIRRLWSRQRRRQPPGGP